MSRILLVLIFIPSISLAQASDFIILKKRNQTIRSFYAGTNIEFFTSNGVYRSALINQVKNDTIYIQEFLIQRIPTTLGTYILDTAGSFRYKYHYKDIYSFGPKKQRGFNMSGSGASLMGGGILLVLGSGVVYLADRDKFSPELMGAGAVLGTLGYLMSKAGSKGIIIGKKGYTLSYMDMTP